MKKNIIFLVGPTAVGKSELAIKLAKKIGGEIISCDSMQVYKGLNILSGKPSKKELKQIKHHLIDIVLPNQDFNVNKFIKLSRQIIDDIHKRGRVPIFVSGTGLYMDSLLNGMFQGPAANKKIRNKLYKQEKQFGNGYLYKKLKEIDKKAAKKIHPNDLRRIIRALEVYQITKKPISELQKQRRGIAQNKSFKIFIFGLSIPREKLYEKINNRVDEMFKKGAVREVEEILNKKTSKTFRQALGIKEINEYLKGKINLDEAKRLLKRNTRRYAKRQLAWFRHNHKIIWLNREISGNIEQMLKYL